MKTLLREMMITFISYNGGTKKETKSLMVFIINFKLS